MRKGPASLLIAIAVGAFATAASVQAADYAVILKTLGDPYWQDMQSGIQSKAKELGVDVDIFAPPTNDDAQTQLQLFEDVLNRNYKGIAFAPISPVNLVQPAARAYKEGIALVNIDDKVDIAALKQAGGNVEATVTTDNNAVGKQAADHIISMLGSAGGDVAIIEGKPGVASAEARKNGATAAFASTPNVKLVTSQPADWDRLKALDVAANIIQSTPDLKGLYCVNDTMALGAMQAVQNAGKTGEIFVVGTDGVPEARDAIKAGKLSATVAQDPARIGSEGLEILVNAARSGKLIAVDSDPKQVALGAILVEK
ncbi:D-allose transporter substrate-binding protein [Rhizobium sp. BK060]|uniref:D-allose transporter substrate-binding protein n=1 Tax=Rhizobium sp. BK060 TaxID=2587096 RepID=UPI0016137CC9|nr:D-allose transporter substrate-binding protein [Rhizobium sp. BK060]MBB3398801.1 D-allose transport system substrate-binding protein [Rhizobium sp. BK060]